SLVPDHDRRGLARAAGGLHPDPLVRGHALERGLDAVVLEPQLARGVVRLLRISPRKEAHVVRGLALRVLALLRLAEELHVQLAVLCLLARGAELAVVAGLLLRQHHAPPPGFT